MEAHNLGSSYFDEYGETNVCQYITSRINISVSNTRTAAAINPMSRIARILIIGVSSSSWGYPKLAGWFISWKMPSFEMDDEMGYPHDFMMETAI